MNEEKYRQVREQLAQEWSLTFGRLRGIVESAADDTEKIKAIRQLIHNHDRMREELWDQRIAAIMEGQHNGIPE
jgi:hypothetical protein